jgi:hypothetical protein
LLAPETRANRPVEPHRLVVDVDLAGEFGVDRDEIVWPPTCTPWPESARARFNG